MNFRFTKDDRCTNSITFTWESPKTMRNSYTIIVNTTYLTTKNKIYDKPVQGVNNNLVDEKKSREEYCLTCNKSFTSKAYLQRIV